MWGLQGVEKEDADKGYQFKDEETRAETARLSGRISGENHPFIEHFKFVKQFEEEGVVARQTIPAPAQFLSELQRPENKASTEAFYPDTAELIEDIAAAYRTFIKELYEAGFRNFQMDDGTGGMLVDENYWKSRDDYVSDVDLSGQFVTLNNKAIENHTADLTITTHVCRGNCHSAFAAAGAYDKVAEVLFGEE